MVKSTNDKGLIGERADDRELDAHGQAAILLVESLIHGLIARSVLTLDEAVEIVEAAVEVKTEMVLDREDAPGMSKSLALLEQISTSFRIDLRNGRR